ncbi:MAG: patatin-like phospholipase family protein [Actinomycetota bacterium]|nr:patatin-like phospholipase family protein [Actinomycetota bacterium]
MTTPLPGLTLVLGGGGTGGIAWETGVLLGLAEAGSEVLSVTQRVIGTSAGSAVGAQVLSGLGIEELFGRQISEEHGEVMPDFDASLAAAVFTALLGGKPLDVGARRRIGAAAVTAPTLPPEVRRAVIEWRLPSHQWPTTHLQVTAVDCESGDLVVFTRDSGVSLVDAVMASCAVPTMWPVVSIGGRSYMDGGICSPVNALLAGDAARVLVLTPLTGPMGASTLVELEQLRANGSRTAVISADDDAIAAMANPLDPSCRAPAAEQGRRQGRAAVEQVRLLLAD